MSENAADAGDDKPRLTEEEKKQNHIASGTLHGNDHDCTPDVG